MKLGVILGDWGHLMLSAMAIPALDTFHVQPLTETMRLPNLYRFRDIASYLSKVINFSHPRVFGVPVGVTALVFHHHLWHQKLESLAIVRRCLRDGKFKRFGRTPTCGKRTDERTDIGTQGHSIYCARISSRGKNNNSLHY